MKIASDEYQFAEEQLDVLIEKIELLHKDSSFIYQLQGPCKKDNSECRWYLTGWKYNDAGRPEKCSLNSCICICKALKLEFPTDIKWNDVLAESCQEAGRGICRTFEDDNILVYNKEVRDPQKADNEFGEKGIRLNAPLIEVNLTKTNSEIIISSERAYSSSLDSDLALRRLRRGY